MTKKNREYKSDAFSMLMEYPQNALDVYNALNGTHYKDPDQIEMMTLDKGISLSVRNDAAFLLQMDLNIYEHQSSYNPNMPLRSLIYYVDTIGPLVRKRDLYSRKRIKIATPHFVVFYNGLEKRPEREVQHLSDAFEKDVDNPELEVTVTVYNINIGQNKELLNKCKVLHDYMYFVDQIRDYVAQNIELGEAIEQTIEDCLREHILEDFLRERRDEVTKMMTLDYTWERREELIREEEHEEGMQEGLQIGRQESRSEGIHALIEICQELGITETVIVEKLVEKYQMSEQEANQWIERCMK